MTDSDVRTYRAATIHEALRMIETDLGRDAVILHTRQIEQRGWLPWQKAQEEVEVTAGIGWTVAGTATALLPPAPIPAALNPNDTAPAVETLERRESLNTTSHTTSRSPFPPAGPAASSIGMPSGV